MVTVQPEQALTLAAIIAEGTFDAAAQRLHLTPSAVSQRVRALEVAVGRPVLQRVRPVELTPAGEAVVRFARQLELLAKELEVPVIAISEAGDPRLNGTDGNCHGMRGTPPDGPGTATRMVSVNCAVISPCAVPRDGRIRPS